MVRNNPYSKLEDLIYIEEKIIPSYVCDRVIKDIKTREWKPHRWYNPTTDKSHSEETKELDMQAITDELQKLLNPAILKAFKGYKSNYIFQGHGKTQSIMNTFSPVRFNRYKPGQIMRQHHDHIHSIFDGNQKGIPVLSMILNFNDDYEGAELFFWEDYVIELGKGDIVIFPSLFLFPHGVTEATKGIRYSGAVWAF